MITLVLRAIRLIASSNVSLQVYRDERRAYFPFSLYGLVPTAAPLILEWSRQAKWAVPWLGWDVELFPAIAIPTQADIKHTMIIRLKYLQEAGGWSSTKLATFSLTNVSCLGAIHLEDPTKRRWRIRIKSQGYSRSLVNGELDKLSVFQAVPDPVRYLLAGGEKPLWSLAVLGS